MSHVLSRQGIQRVLGLLDQLDKWIDEIPPLPTPQRFGNLAFRTWGERLEEVRSSQLFCPLHDLNRVQACRRAFNSDDAGVARCGPPCTALSTHRVWFLCAHRLWHRT